MNNKTLSGKVVLVTGGGKNIGKAIALAFADDGATVAVNVMSSRAEGEAVVSEINNSRGKASLFVADVSDPEAVKSMVDDITKQFGRIDMVVLNAAYRKDTPFLEMTFAEWRKVMAMNLDGAFHCVTNCLPHLIKNGGGSIILFGGANALKGSAGKVNTSVAKHGLVGMTKALAKELGPHNIRVNCVSPGPINTTRPDYRGPKPPIPKEAVLGRRGEPNEVAAMVHFLCSPKGAYVTGQIIHVNGGVLM